MTGGNVRYNISVRTFWPVPARVLKGVPSAVARSNTCFCSSARRGDAFFLTHTRRGASRRGAGSAAATAAALKNHPASAGSSLDSFPG